MIRDLDQARNFWARSLFLAAGLALGTGTHTAQAAAGADAAADESYTWSAELIAFDESSRTMTVRARVVNHAGIEKLAELSEGDRAMLTWSGIFTASGIRTINPGTESEYDRFTMPVEFVTTAMDDQYVEFRVPIPEADVTKMAALTPGQWVTATSPHRPDGWEDTVTTVRAFTDVS